MKESRSKTSSTISSAIYLAASGFLDRRSARLRTADRLLALKIWGGARFSIDLPPAVLASMMQPVQRIQMLKQARRQIIEALSPAVDLIYPPRCPLCGEGIAAQRGVCGVCWHELLIPGEPSCITCQRPFGADGPVSGAQCAPCMQSPPDHDGIAAGTIYNDASRKLILSYKHGNRIALAPMLAQLMAARLPDAISAADSNWRFVPVPLHRWRLWRRGYNQAAMLAGELTKITGVPTIPAGLQRIKATPSLGGLGRKARREALAGALRVNPARNSDITGRNIVLVDDVLTSGATSDACVKTLKQAGARKVVIACFARVLDEAKPLTARDAASDLPTPERETPRA